MIRFAVSQYKHVILVTIVTFIGKGVVEILSEYAPYASYSGIAIRKTVSIGLNNWYNCYYEAAGITRGWGKAAAHDIFNIVVILTDGWQSGDISISNIHEW